MYHSALALLPFLALLPTLTYAGMCAAWFDADKASDIQDCCSSVSGNWKPIGTYQGACLFRDNTVMDKWKECAEPLLGLRPESLSEDPGVRGWQCVPCEETCTVTLGGPTLTMPSKTGTARAGWPQKTLGGSIKGQDAQAPIEDI